MKATIDRAGRVVIPVDIRRRAGLEPGTELEVVLEGSAIRLLRTAPGPRLTRVGKRLVAKPAMETGALPAVDIARLVEEERDRRLR